VVMQIDHAASRVCPLPCTQNRSVPAFSWYQR
jgi:hypothetical protein